VRRSETRAVTADSTARNLTDCVDALAAALRDAGVSPEESAGLLAAAARATMHAVMLEALLDDTASAPPPVSLAA
jgi:alkylhydroperoxidase family enzyme